MLVISLIILIFSTSSTTLGEDAYGPFEMRINSIEQCKGPRKFECIKARYALAHEGKQIEVSVVVPEDIKLTEFRLIVGRGKTTRPLISIQLRNPCQQVIVNEYLQQLTKDPRTCILPKGSFNLTVDVASLFQKFWAAKFFYGNLYNKAIVLNDKCNICCNIMNVTISPKSDRL